MSTVGPPQKAFQFLRLPDPIRLMIYDYSFSSQNRFPPRMSTVSQQVRKECLMLYSKTARLYWAVVPLKSTPSTGKADHLSTFLTEGTIFSQIPCVIRIRHPTSALDGILAYLEKICFVLKDPTGPGRLGQVRLDFPEPHYWRYLPAGGYHQPGMPTIEFETHEEDGVLSRSYSEMLRIAL